MVERQPFLIGNAPNGKVVHIDLDSPRVSRTEGEADVPRARRQHRVPRAHQLAARRAARGHRGDAARSSPRWSNTTCSNPSCSTSSSTTARSIASPASTPSSEERLAKLDGAALGKLHERGYLQPMYMVIASFVEFPRPDRTRQQAECCRSLTKIRELSGVDARALPDGVLESDRAAGAARPGRALAAGERRRSNRYRRRSATCRGFYRDATVGRDARRAGDRRPLLLQRRSLRLQFQVRDGCAWMRCSRTLARHGTSAHPPVHLRGLDHHRHARCRVFATTTMSTSARAMRWPASGSAIARASPRTTTCPTTWPAWRSGAAASRCSRRSRSRNLYVGPLDFTPAGQAISLVDFAKPDFARFPRFAQAVQARAAWPSSRRRRAVHSEHVVAPRRVARLVQRARQLLVAPVAGLHGRADRRADARACMTVRDLPPRATRGLAEPVSTTTYSTPTRAPRRISRSTPAASLGPLTDETARDMRARLLARLNR